MTPRVPPHQSPEESWYEKGDSGGYFPTAESASDYKRLVEEQEYHQIRHEMIASLLKKAIEVCPDSALGRQAGLTALDFGIGDGGEFRRLGLPVSKLYGIDTSEHMINLARENFRGIEFTGLIGGAESITQIEDRLQLVTCINAIGYLSQEEEYQFWSYLSERLDYGAVVLVVTGNQLFDLFALNSGTAEFFEAQFGVDLAHELLVRGESERFRNARRKNPLTVEIELSQYGLTKVAENFCMWHIVPPELLLLEEGVTLRQSRWQSRNFAIHALALSEVDRWQALFRCSVFGFVAIKN